MNDIASISSPPPADQSASTATPPTGVPATAGDAPPPQPPDHAPSNAPHPNAPPSTASAPAGAAPTSTSGPSPASAGPLPEGRGTPASAVRGPLPFDPQTADDLWRYAQMLAPSPMVPDKVRGNPSGVMHLLLIGKSLGLTIPMSLQIYVIEGKPSLPAQTILAICKAHPLCAGFFLVESNEERAVFRAKRRDIRTGEIVEDVTLDFTIEEAEPLIARAKKNPEKSAWATQPKTMLRWRAVSSLARMVFPDVLGGIAGSTEEMLDALDVSEGRVQTVSVSRAEVDAAKPGDPNATPAPAPVARVDATSLGLPDGKGDAIDAAFREVTHRPPAAERAAEPVPARGVTSRVASRAAAARPAPAEDLFYPCAGCGAPVVSRQGDYCQGCRDEPRR